MKHFFAILLLAAICCTLCSCNLIMKEIETAITEITSNNNPKPDGIDTNGFSSMEELVEARVAMLTGSATEEQVRKVYPEYYWKNMSDFNAQYSNYSTGAVQIRSSLAKQFGDDYQVTYIIQGFDTSKDNSNDSFTEEENQVHIQMYGLPISERRVYSITVSIIIQGSLGEREKVDRLTCLKIGDKWYGY